MKREKDLAKSRKTGKLITGLGVLGYGRQPRTHIHAWLERNFFSTCDPLQILFRLNSCGGENLWKFFAFLPAVNKETNKFCYMGRKIRFLRIMRRRVGLKGHSWKKSEILTWNFMQSFRYHVKKNSVKMKITINDITNDFHCVNSTSRSRTLPPAACRHILAFGSNYGRFPP